MREVKSLKDQLIEEKEKMAELFEDANKVRDELMNELLLLEK